MQLLLQSLLHNGGKFLAIQLMGAVVADIRQCFVRVRNDRRTLIGSDRRDRLNQIRDQFRVGYDDLLRLIVPQIGKLRQHLLRGAQEKGCLIVCVIKALSRHDDPAVHLILWIQKMHITGRHHRLVELLSQPHHLAVHLLNIFDGIDIRMLR